MATFKAIQVHVVSVVLEFVKYTIDKACNVKSF